MAINEFTPEQKAEIEKFWPALEQLVRKVNNSPLDFLFTGFIYGGDEKNPILIHVGNVMDRGADLVHIHYGLSCMAAAIDDAGLTERTEISAAPEGPTSEEVADKLAVALLAGHSEGTSEEVKALLDEYLKSRAPR